MSACYLRSEPKKKRKERKKKLREGLGFWAFTTMAWVQSLLGELRFCKPLSTAKKKEIKKDLNQRELAFSVVAIATAT